MGHERGTNFNVSKTYFEKPQSSSEKCGYFFKKDDNSTVFGFKEILTYPKKKNECPEVPESLKKAIKRKIFLKKKPATICYYHVGILTNTYLVLVKI